MFWSVSDSETRLLRREDENCARGVGMVREASLWSDERSFA